MVKNYLKKIGGITTAALLAGIISSFTPAYAQETNKSQKLFDLVSTVEKGERTVTKDEYVTMTQVKFQLGDNGYVLFAVDFNQENPAVSDLTDGLVIAKTTISEDRTEFNYIFCSDENLDSVVDLGESGVFENPENNDDPLNFDEIDQSTIRLIKIYSEYFEDTSENKEYFQNLLNQNLDKLIEFYESEEEQSLLPDTLQVIPDEGYAVNELLSNKLVELGRFVLNDEIKKASVKKYGLYNQVKIEHEGKTYTVTVNDGLQHRDDISIIVETPLENDMVNSKGVSDYGFDGNGDWGEELTYEKGVLVRTCGTFTEEELDQKRADGLRLLVELEPEIDLLLEYYRNK